MKKLCFYVPESHLGPVKDAVFAAGAGRIGAYGECCWQTLGQGQFRPLEGSRPFLGDRGELETVDEYRVEMLCADEHSDAVIVALRAAHPYEEPAWDLTSVEAPGAG
ncbi:MAG: YqfO family protein [Pseudomonadota bacterium]